MQKIQADVKIRISREQEASVVEVDLLYYNLDALSETSETMVVKFASCLKRIYNLSDAERE